MGCRHPEVVAEVRVDSISHISNRSGLLHSQLPHLRHQKKERKRDEKPEPRDSDDDVADEILVQRRARKEQQQKKGRLEDAASADDGMEVRLSTL